MPHPPLRVRLTATLTATGDTHRLRRRWTKRNIFCAVVLGLAGVSTVLSFAGVRLYQGPKPTSQGSAAQTTVQLPQTVDGMTILHTPGLDAQVAKEGGNVSNFHLTGYYGTDTGRIQALVTVHKTTNSYLDNQDQLRIYEAGLSKGPGQTIPSTLLPQARLVGSWVAAM